MFPLLLFNFALLATAVTAAKYFANLPAEFDSPPPIYRLKLRYWFVSFSSAMNVLAHSTDFARLPDAGVDHDLLINDISNIKKVGAGGLELIPYYNYGFGTGDISNWDMYAFGKPAFKNVLRRSLETCRANNLVMDFALGASQGQGVPVKPLTPGLAVQLVYGRTSVEGGELFQEELPEPMIDWRQNLGFMQPQEVFGGSRLVGVSAGAVKSSKSYL